MEENIKIEAQEEGVKEPQDTKVVEKDKSVPFSRFNEVIAERNKLREDMESLNKEKELARAEKLEKDGEYQTLLAEERQKAKDLEEKYNSTNETLTRYETDERNRLLSKLPEDRREKYESVDISTLRNMIEDFGEQPKPNVKQAEAGLQRKTLSENPFKELSNEERKKDWSSVLNSYKK
ncbi:MAG TPA: hypothetical protein DHV30_14800 [Balneola sp.]|nr:hypothetical protein [Balneola sp.]|tara:strand:+ start:1462 stop:1998 length:537 start_codon:yes stop_codon:yes gene_type:complete